MNATKRLFIGIAALTAAGIVGCLDSESTSSQNAAALPTGTDALLSYASDASRPAPKRLEACEVLSGRLAGFDSASADYAKLDPKVRKVCAPVPGFRHRGGAPADSARCTELRDSLMAWRATHPNDSTSATALAISAEMQIACFPPPPPPRPCDSLLVLLAGKDSTSPGWDSLNAVIRACRQANGELPPPPPPRTLRCDSLLAQLQASDSTTSERDSLYTLYRNECTAPAPKIGKGAPSNPGSIAPAPRHPAPSRRGVKETPDTVE